MIFWLFLGWLVISPVLAVLSGMVIRFRDVAPVPACAAPPAATAEKMSEAVQTGSRLVPAAAAG